MFWLRLVCFVTCGTCINQTRLWVDLRYTNHFTVSSYFLLYFLTICVSRKGILPFSSSSYVFLGLPLASAWFGCSERLVSFPFLRPYRFHNWGVNVTGGVATVRCFNNAIYKFATIENWGLPHCHTKLLLIYFFPRKEKLVIVSTILRSIMSDLSNFVLFANWIFPLLPCMCWSPLSSWRSAQWCQLRDQVFSPKN